MIFENHLHVDKASPEGTVLALLSHFEQCRLCRRFQFCLGIWCKPAGVHFAPSSVNGRGWTCGSVSQWFCLQWIVGNVRVCPSLRFVCSSSDYQYHSCLLCLPNINFFFLCWRDLDLLAMHVVRESWCPDLSTRVEHSWCIFSRDRHRFRGALQSLEASGVRTGCGH